MTFKKKILIGYGIIFLFMGLVIAWAVVHLILLGNATDSILRENYRSILAAENMVDALERQDSGTLLLLMKETRQGITLFRENEAMFFQWLARAKDNITIPGESELIGAIEIDYAAYRKRFSTLTDLCDGLPSYQKTVYPLFLKVRGECIRLRYLNETTMYSASVMAGNVAKRAIWSTIVVALSALVVALIFSLFLANRIVRPIQRFMEASRRISSGDYAVVLHVETSDELGHLAREFNEMTTQLRQYHEMNIEQIIAEKNKGDAILSSIEDGLVVFDTRLTVTAINPAARQMLGLGVTEISSLLCGDIIQDLSVCTLIENSLETGVIPVVPEEQRIIVFSDGNRSRHYLFSITAIRGKENSMSGIVILFRDVTRLREIELLKSEFVMAASHELRTPLTSLGMSVALLMEHATTVLSENDRNLLRVAHEEVHRMKALVNDLLDLSRIEAGRIEMKFENVLVSTLFEHARAVFKSQLDIKKVTLVSDITDALLKVRADANKITWILTNLISNALRYVKNGGHIKLVAQPVYPHIHLSVHDDGPGIPLEYQSRIFQKFVQVKGREPGGSGLGLAICKEMVRAHGGAIWVESSPGQGSTFTFTLPTGEPNGKIN